MTVYRSMYFCKTLSNLFIIDRSFSLRLVFLDMIADFINKPDENHSGKDADRKIIGYFFHKRMVNVVIL